MPVSQSLGLLRESRRIASALRLLANGYLVIWIPIFGFGGKSLAQLLAAYQLRFHCALEYRPVAGPAVRWLWLCAIVDSSTLVCAGSAAALGQLRILRAIALVNTVATTVALLSMVRLAATLARWLDHEPILRGLRIIGALAAIAWLMMALIVLFMAPSGWAAAGCSAGPVGLVFGLALHDLSRELRQPADGV